LHAIAERTKRIRTLMRFDMGVQTELGALERGMKDINGVGNTL